MLLLPIFVKFNQQPIFFFLITGATDKSQSPVLAIAKILSQSFRCWGMEKGLQTLPAENFPAMKILLSILATLPVSSAIAERSFSVVRLIGLDLHTTMDQARLDNLCLMYIHNGDSISTGVIIKKFAATICKIKL